MHSAERYRQHTTVGNIANAECCRTKLVEAWQWETIGRLAQGRRTGAMRSLETRRKGGCMPGGWVGADEQELPDHASGDHAPSPSIASSQATQYT
eukprot:750671-Hanusia_phi.AAC.6